MKLDNKRTMLIGFAFLAISAFWQVYDNIVPLILKYFFHIGDTLSGGIMALDNILALFLLPFFGNLSDRCRSPLGKRTPFIIAGTMLSVVFMLLLPIADRMLNLTFFIIALLLTLISMGTYRSPAVALMPELTPKPLRSKANAVINLMGAIGGIIALLMIKFLVPSGERPDYLPVFIGVAATMVICVVILVATIRERKLAEAIGADKDEDEPADESAASDAKLPKDVFRSLVLILCAVESFVKPATDKIHCYT